MLHFPPEGNGAGGGDRPGDISSEVGVFNAFADDRARRNNPLHIFRCLQQGRPRIGISVAQGGFLVRYFGAMFQMALCLWARCARHLFSELADIVFNHSVTWFSSQPFGGLLGEETSVVNRHCPVVTRRLAVPLSCFTPRFKTGSGIWAAEKCACRVCMRFQSRSMWTGQTCGRCRRVVL